MKNRGFTLIELLVVIVIIGLLSYIVLVAVNSARVKARDAQRKTALKQISTALEMYYQQNGTYPDIPAHSNVCASDWGDCWGTGGTLASALAPYLAKLPQDPKFPGTSVTCGNWFVYVYEKKSANKYCLAGTLENTSDPAIKVCSQSCHSLWPNYYFTN